MTQLTPQDLPDLESVTLQPNSGEIRRTGIDVVGDLPFEDSVPEAGASLESILCTEELRRCPSRPPDYERENRALVALVSALADSPSTIFQTLAETILDTTECDSAGLSLLTRDGKRLACAIDRSLVFPQPARLVASPVGSYRLALDQLLCNEGFGGGGRA